MADDAPKKSPKTATITVAGVSFTADQVKSIVLEIDGREVRIGAKATPKTIGFSIPTTNTKGKND